MSLEHHGARGMPSEAVKGCKAMRDTFAPIASAMELIYLTGRKAFELYQMLKQKEFAPASFKNPVYNIVIKGFIPAIQKVMDGVFNRENKYVSLNPLSQELSAMLSYEEKLSGIDSTARIHLMNFPDFEEVLRSIHGLSTMPPKSKLLGGLLLQTLHLLVNGAYQYEQDMKPLRCALFRRFGSHGPNYDDYQAMCDVLVRLGRRRGSTEDGVASASRLAKENNFLSTMCPTVAYVCEMRGSDAERRSESHHTAQTVWKTFITFLSILEDDASKKLLMEASLTSSANNSATSNSHTMTSTGDDVASCWPDCVFS